MNRALLLLLFAIEVVGPATAVAAQPCEPLCQIDMKPDGGNCSGDVAVCPHGNSDGRVVAVSGTGNAAGPVAISLYGNSEGTVAVSGTGQSSGTVAASACDLLP
jgi:hypothetical protein